MTATTTWRSLPLELWLRIYCYLPYYRDIAECRLVCRAWDAPAERALFSIGFNLGITRQMKRLCYSLTKKPALANTIKYVAVSDVNADTDLPLLKEVLPLLLNSNLLGISGYNCHPSIIATLQEILQNSPVKLQRLRRLPSVHQFDEAYAKLVYAYRSTLEHVEIGYTNRHDSPTMDHIFAHLCEFRNMVHVKINGLGPLNFEDLDTLLQGLPETCKSIELDLSSGMHFNWSPQRVKKIYNLTKLKICRYPMPYNMIEYFIYKYPNLESIEVSGITFKDDNFQRIAAPLLQIASVRFGSSYDGNDIPAETIRTFSTRSNSLSLRYEEPESATELDLTRDATKGTCDIDMSLDGVMTNVAYTRLLSNLGTSRVTCLEVNLLNEKHSYPDYRTVTEPTFLDIVRAVPLVEEFRFTQSRITNLEFLEPSLPTLEHLKTLRISSAEIGSLVLPTISKMAPRLESLKLESCIVLNEDGEFDNITCIMLPCNSISTLSIALEDSTYMWRSKQNPLFIHHQSMFNYLKIKRSAFVRLTTLESCVSVQHYMLLKGEQPMLITKQEFLEYSKGCPKFDIECKSLSLLEFNIKSFKMKMQFRDGKLENGSKSKIMALEEHGAELKNIAPDMFVDRARQDFDELKKEHIALKALQLMREEARARSDKEEADEDEDEDEDEEEDDDEDEDEEDTSDFESDFD